MEKNKTGKPALPARPTDSSGRTGRYIKYAIGEIVLVVIGILIALQINNWNEKRKLISEEKEIIVSLTEELKSNIKLLKFSLETNNEVTNATEKLLDSIKNNTINSFNQYEVIYSLSYNPVKLNLPVLEEILTSDNKLITYKKKIIDDLRRLNSRQTRIIKDLNYLDEIYNFRISEFTIRMGLTYDVEESKNLTLTLSDLKQEGISKAQFRSLISLTNDLRLSWINSQSAMLKKAKQLLEKLE